jgi:hypothetical protein
MNGRNDVKSWGDYCGVAPDSDATSAMKVPLIAIALICLLTTACQIVSTESSHEIAIADPRARSAAPGEKIIAKGLTFENEDVTLSTDIHYTGNYCNECHVEPALETGSAGLKFGGDYGQLCRCHADSSAVYIHPFDITPTQEKKKRIPSDFPLEDEKVTCLTCHDIYLQCQKRLFNRDSLRGAPYPKRTDFCYKCHAMENYEQTDPHLQLNETGEIVLETCMICHEEKPDEKHATFKDVLFVGDIEVMCRRCHHIAGNHSGNADHMGIRPSTDGMQRIRTMEEKYDVRLPLDENGKMTCITCHNPHAKGVIPEDSPGAKGADSRYRHRLPEDLCKECHMM